MRTEEVSKKIEKIRDGAFLDAKNASPVEKEALLQMAKYAQEMLDHEVRSGNDNA